MAGENGQGKMVSDEERTQQILEQLKSVHAFDLAYETMVGLVNFGSQKMGLLDETREVRDLDDARLSIELVRAILEVLEREQGDERTRGLHDALAQMQLAYAHAVQLVNAERAARHEAAAGREAEGAAARVEPEAADPEAAVRDDPSVQAEAAVRGAPPKKPAAGKRAAAKKPAAAKKKPAAAKKKPAAES
jgi:hypothetical protein